MDRGQGRRYGIFPLIVTFFFGLTPTWGMLLVPFIGFVTGLGFAFFGHVGERHRARNRLRSSTSPSPLSRRFPRRRDVLPDSPTCLLGCSLWPQLNPLYHCVELVRAAFFGLPEPLVRPRSTPALSWPAFAGARAGSLAVRTLVPTAFPPVLPPYAAWWLTSTA